MERAVDALRTALASVSDKNERRALSVLTDLVASDGGASQRAWWTWIGAEPNLVDELLVYAVARAFAAQVPLASVFKRETLVRAETIPALRQEADLSREASALLERLILTTWPAETLAQVGDVIPDIKDPRVRQHVIRFAYKIVKHQRARPNAVEQAEPWSQQVTRVLLLGVTDVWSAVRKESAHAAAAIVCQFSALSQIDAFASALLKIAVVDDWKAQEGALLTLTAIVASIQRETVPPPAASMRPTASSRTSDLIKGPAQASPPPVVTTVYHLGRHRGLQMLPPSLSVRLKPVLYAALKHSQLGVREAAALCFVRYVEICDEATRVLSFQEVMSKLNRLTSDPPSSELTTVASSADEGANQSVELLDAADAEGLLDVLAKLVPQLPVTFLVKHWKLVFPTLERYVVHIASTVRQRSSAVVLALAELSLVETAPAPSASIELLYQMLLALAERRLDVGVCWQRLEGRLLSVDLLVGLLGRDRLWRIGSRQNALHLVSKPRTNCGSRGVDEWLPDAMVPQATWVLDEEEELRFQQVSLSTPSIIERLNGLSELKKVLSRQMWQRVLSGWLCQTREAFESTQFELRRIARQVLPGLVRLCLWCDQLSLVHEPPTSATADAKGATTGSSALVDAWTWSCVRHAVLHAQLVRESGDLSTAARDVLVSCGTFAANTMRPTLMEAATSRNEPDAVVVRVEAILLASLSVDNGSLDRSPVVCAFGDVHSNIPSSFHHPLAGSTMPAAPPSRDRGSIDRQLSIALVLLMPVIVRRLVVQQGDPALWRMAERVALSWLATDDMFRWITIGKLAAQSALLHTLQALLASPETLIALATTGGDDEVAVIVRTLESVLPVTRAAPESRLVDALVQIYVYLWCVVAASDASNSRVRAKIATALAFLHDHERSRAVAPSKSDAAKSEWDDWDGDSEGVTIDISPNGKDHEVRPTASTEDLSADEPEVVSALRANVSPDVIDVLALELQRLIRSDQLLDAQPHQHHHHAVLQSFSASLEGHVEALRPN